MLQENNIPNQHTIASYFACSHLENGVSLGGNKTHFLAKAELTASQLEQSKSRVLPTQLASIVKNCWKVMLDVTRPLACLSSLICR